MEGRKHLAPMHVVREREAESLGELRSSEVVEANGRDWGQLGTH